ncbi:c-type cytochrome [Frigidibacter sp. ROC022]|uniref:c-type cytochrome n=1 Tax=Frigidibacter sp. ROC022 TaxID=2971796 RepID=UPI00215A8F8B|nr:cytochrome c [Frigidibacter sp. ROC022]MCR8722989.1 cytochrome c [Frigidibacter sp. ROC022]
MTLKATLSVIGLMAVVAAPAQAQDASEGAALFERNCASCHGAEARGNGPLAPVLIIQPTDLTRLAAKNDGVFPMTRVVARIDGRDTLVSHGSPMPVFGPYFDGDRHIGLKTESGQPVMVTEQVADVVAWLQSIQE